MNLHNDTSHTITQKRTYINPKNTKIHSCNRVKMTKVTKGKYGKDLKLNPDKFTCTSKYIKRKKGVVNLNVQHNIFFHIIKMNRLTADRMKKAFKFIRRMTTLTIPSRPADKGGCDSEG